MPTDKNSQKSQAEEKKLAPEHAAEAPKSAATPKDEKQAQPAEPEAKIVEVEAAPSNGKSILIVEDEKPLSHALEMKLKKNGYETKVVMNGQDALAELKAKQYHMVLMDLIMPVMDGFELLTAMNEANLKIPAIVLSNLGQEEDRKKAAELGAIEYYVKANTPISEIIERVKKSA